MFEMKNIQGEEKDISGSGGTGKLSEGCTGSESDTVSHQPCGGFHGGGIGISVVYPKQAGCVSD